MSFTALALFKLFEQKLHACNTVNTSQARTLCTKCTRIYTESERLAQYLLETNTVTEVELFVAECAKQRSNCQPNTT